MPVKNLSIVLALALSSFPATAQPIISPEVQPDGRVTFRLRAPDAQRVQVRCEGVGETNLVKDDQGLWSFTSSPLEPDIYAYTMVIDGVRITDPNNPLLKYNLLGSESLVHVPGPKTLPWEINDVPRGVLHRHFYHSTVADHDRDFLVYTPPGYDATSKKRYPVLYLLHGYSDDTSGWICAGYANVILDNLIARGQAKPLVVVMPLGYGTMEVIRGGWQGLRNRELWKENMDKFRQALLTEVMPHAEKAYRISTKREDHAIAGLSMGGSESLLTGLNQLDRFAWIGAFSSGGLGTNFPALLPNLDEKANAKLRLLWIGCGQQDGLMTQNREFHEWLTSKGVKHTWVETPGYHSFRVWRRYLADFTPLLFRK